MNYDKCPNCGSRKLHLKPCLICGFGRKKYRTTQNIESPIKINSDCRIVRCQRCGEQLPISETPKSQTHVCKRCLNRKRFLKAHSKDYDVSIDSDSPFIDVIKRKRPKKTSGNKNIRLVKYAQVSYSSLRGLPVQGGAPSLGKKR